MKTAWRSLFDDVLDLLIPLGVASVGLAAMLAAMGVGIAVALYLIRLALGH